MTNICVYMIARTVWYVYKPPMGHAGYASIRPLAFSPKKIRSLNPTKTENRVGDAGISRVTHGGLVYIPYCSSDHIYAYIGYYDPFLNF